MRSNPFVLMPVLSRATAVAFNRFKYENVHLSDAI